MGSLHIRRTPSPTTLQREERGDNGVARNDENREDPPPPRTSLLPTDTDTPTSPRNGESDMDEDDSGTASTDTEHVEPLAARTATHQLAPYLPGLVGDGDEIREDRTRALSRILETKRKLRLYTTLGPVEGDQNTRVVIAKQAPKIISVEESPSCPVHEVEPDPESYPRGCVSRHAKVWTKAMNVEFSG